jgi:hypothetical protein
LHLSLSRHSFLYNSFFLLHFSLTLFWFSFYIPFIYTIIMSFLSFSCIFYFSFVSFLLISPALCPFIFSCYLLWAWLRAGWPGGAGVRVPVG